MRTQVGRAAEQAQQDFGIATASSTLAVAAHIRHKAVFLSHSAFFSSVLMDLNQNSIGDNTELKARDNWNELKGEVRQKWS